MTLKLFDNLATQLLPFIRLQCKKWLTAAQDLAKTFTSDTVVVSMTPLFAALAQLATEQLKQSKQQE